MSEQRLIVQGEFRDILSQRKEALLKQGDVFGSMAGTISGVIKLLDEVPAIDPEMLPIVQGLRANIVILEEAVKSKHNAEDMLTITKLNIEKMGLIDKLERYESGEKEGKLIVFPVAIGQNVYHITTCKNFAPVLDGTLYDNLGGPGTATGYYCPCELSETCPFESEDFQCEKFVNTPAIFEDVAKGYIIDDFEECVMLQYSGTVLFDEFGKTWFLDKKEAEAKLKERKLYE